MKLSSPPVRSLLRRPGDLPATLSDGRASELQFIGFPPCHSSYGALALTPAGLSPAERASLCWTHISCLLSSCGQFRCSPIMQPGATATRDRTCSCRRWCTPLANGLCQPGRPGTVHSRASIHAVALVSNHRSTSARSQPTARVPGPPSLIGAGKSPVLTRRHNDVRDRLSTSSTADVLKITGYESRAVFCGPPVMCGSDIRSTYYNHRFSTSPYVVRLCPSEI